MPNDSVGSQHPMLWLSSWQLWSSKEWDILFCKRFQFIVLRCIKFAHPFAKAKQKSAFELEPCVQRRGPVWCDNKTKLCERTGWLGGRTKTRW